MSEDVALKPCPFCGGEAWLRQWGSGWALTCRNNRTLARLADFTERECPIAIVLTPTKAEAIAAWNTRAAPVVTDAMVEAACAVYWQCAFDSKDNMRAALKAALEVKK